MTLQTQSRRQPAGQALPRKRRRTPLLDIVILAMITLIVMVAVVAPFVAPQNINTSDVTSSLQPPSSSHWLGTDDQGRDVLWRVLVGCQVTVFAAAGVVLAFAIISILLAVAAATGPRWLDQALMRFTDITLTVPGLVLGMGFAAALGPSLQSAIIAMIISGWPMSARLLRSAIRDTSSLPFVEGARTMGVTTGRLMFRHVLPNSLDVLIVKWAGDIGQTILVIAGMSFIGLGAQPPSAEWGAMVASAKGYVATAWWAALAPGVAIAVTAAAFGLLGDILQRRLSTGDSR